MIYVITSISTGTVINVVPTLGSTETEITPHYDWQVRVFKDGTEPIGVATGWKFDPSANQFSPPSLDALKTVAGKALDNLYAQIVKDHPSAPASLLSNAKDALALATSAEAIQSITMDTNQLKPLGA